MTETNPDEMGPPPDERGRLSFDKAILELMRDTAKLAIARHPELRSVAVILDFRGELNAHPAVDKGLWIGDQGAVTKIDAVFGSIRNTFIVLDVMMGKAAAIEDNLRSRVLLLGDELKKRSLELESKTTEKAAAQPVAGEPGLGYPAISGNKPDGWPDEIWYDYTGAVYNAGPARPDAQRKLAEHVPASHLIAAGYTAYKFFDSGQWWATQARFEQLKQEDERNRLAAQAHIVEQHRERPAEQQAQGAGAGGDAGAAADPPADNDVGSAVDR